MSLYIAITKSNDQFNYFVFQLYEIHASLTYLFEDLNTDRKYINSQHFSQIMKTMSENLWLVIDLNLIEEISFFLS